MGRPLSLQPGDIINGFLVLKVRGQGRAKGARLLAECKVCGKHFEAYKNTLKKANSCGCVRHDSTTWNAVGPKTMPWQLPAGVAAFNNLFASYFKSAERRGYEFTLTKEIFNTLITRPCTYCGDCCSSVCRGLGKSSGDFRYTGLDRVDNLVGYVPDNVVPCCRTCNYMKHTLQLEAFTAHIEKIYKHSVQKKLD